MIPEYEPKIALSFSRLSDFDTCPHKFKDKYIDKTYPDDSNNPAFAKGNAIHSQLENYILYLRGERDKPIIGTAANNVLPIIDSMYESCNGEVYPEKQLALDQNWVLCDWFDKPHIVKYRAIVDMLVFFDPTTLLVNDFKSGKVREYEDGDRTQLKLTAVMLFMLYPNIDRIVTSYLFVEHKKTITVTFHRKDLEGMKKHFDEAHYEVNVEEDFKFKKNRYCNWCLSTTCPVKS